MKSNSKKADNRRVVYLLIFILLSACLLTVELYRGSGNVFSADKTLNELLYGIISRGFAALICILMIAYCSFGNLFLLNTGGKLKAFVLLIPCWLVVINNFPFISVLNGTAGINAEVYLIVLFALQCFLVGFFEEVAFRGCVFMLVLQGKNKSRKDVFSKLNIFVQGKTKDDISLQEGDVIIVPPYEALVKIEGNVKRPMKYEMKNDETVGDKIIFYFIIVNICNNCINCV